MAILTLASSMFNVIALHTVMPGVCTSTCIALLLKALVSKESIPVACLIQQEGTLISMLGYIVMTITVSFHAAVCKSGISSGIQLLMVSCV